MHARRDHYRCDRVCRAHRPAAPLMRAAGSTTRRRDGRRPYNGACPRVPRVRDDRVGRLRRDRRRRGRPRGRARARGARARRRRARGRRGDRHAHELAQLRGDPRRPVLPDRVAEGAPVRRGARAAVRVLRRARHRAPAHRQARRRDHGRRDRGGRVVRGAGRGQRRRRPRVAVARRRSATLEPAVAAVAGLPVAVDRHRRQPRADAGAAGRCGARRRGGGAQRARRRRRRRRRRPAPRRRRTRAADAAMRDDRQRGGPVGARGRALARRLSARPRAARRSSPRRTTSRSPGARRSRTSCTRSRPAPTSACT